MIRKKIFADLVAVSRKAAKGRKLSAKFRKKLSFEQLLHVGIDTFDSFERELNLVKEGKSDRSSLTRSALAHVHFELELIVINKKQV